MEMDKVSNSQHSSTENRAAENRQEWLTSTINAAASRSRTIISDQHMSGGDSTVNTDFVVAGRSEPKANKQIYSVTEHVRISLVGDRIQVTSSPEGKTDAPSTFTHELSFKEKRLVGSKHVTSHSERSPFLTALESELTKQVRIADSTLNRSWTPDSWDTLNTKLKVIAAGGILTFGMVFSALVVKQFADQLTKKSPDSSNYVLRLTQPGAGSLTNYQYNQSLTKQDIKILADAFNEAAKVTPPSDPLFREIGNQFAYLAASRLKDNPADGVTAQIREETRRTPEDFSKVASLIVSREALSAGTTTVTSSTQSGTPATNVNKPAVSTPGNANSAQPTKPGKTSPKDDVKTKSRTDSPPGAKKASDKNPALKAKPVTKKK